MADYKRLFAGILPAIIVLILSIAAAGEIRVCQHGCEISDIQTAINSANPGDGIAVERGIYSEDLVAGKAVTLQGHDSGSGVPVLEGSITAAADGGKISGFQFAGSHVTDGGDSCMLNIMGPIGIYQNNIPGSGWVCPGSTGLWNSTFIRAVTPQSSPAASDQAMTSSRIVHRIPPWAIPSQPWNRSARVTSVQARSVEPPSRP